MRITFVRSGTFLDQYYIRYYGFHDANRTYTVLEGDEDVLGDDLLDLVKVGRHLSEFNLKNSVHDDNVLYISREVLEGHPELLLKYDIDDLI